VDSGYGLARKEKETALGGKRRNGDRNKRKGEAGYVKEMH